MSNLFAGIDSSTQGTKLLVIDLDASQVVWVDAVNYDNDLPQYNTKNGVRQTDHVGVSESDPNMWIEALDVLFDRLKKSDVPQKDIKAISVIFLSEISLAFWPERIKSPEEFSIAYS